MLRLAVMMLCVSLLLTTSADAGDWPRFRGPNGSGISDSKTAPTQWGPDRNVKWKAEIDGRGNGSPIVSNGRVFVAAAKDRGRQRSLLCFDRKDGKQLWAKTVEFDKVMPTHQTNPYAGTTPAADGERVVVWHGSAGVHCYDFDGNELWSRDVGEVRHIWGYGSSPIIHHGVVYLNVGPGERQRMTALDLKSGEVLWETPEPGGKSGVGDERGGWVGSWSTPVVATVMGEDVLVCSMPTRVNGYHPKTGEILWFCRGLENMPRGNLVYTSPNVSGDLCVVLGGFNGPSIAFEMGGRGDTTEFRL
ncbi:MAG: PQQ-binding-like beta-propeller repeat protein, partial [Planctomycetaceae bacterium]